MCIMEHEENMGGKASVERGINGAQSLSESKISEIVQLEGKQMCTNTQA